MLGDQPIRATRIAAAGPVRCALAVSHAGSHAASHRDERAAAFSPVSMGVKVCIFVRDPRAFRR
jgi:hypothetical protein